MFVKIIIKNYLDVNIMDLHLENKILQYQTIQTKIITVILNQEIAMKMQNYFPPVHLMLKIKNKVNNFSRLRKYKFLKLFLENINILIKF